MFGQVRSQEVSVSFEQIADGCHVTFDAGSGVGLLVNTQGAHRIVDLVYVAGGVQLLERVLSE